MHKFEIDGDFESVYSRVGMYGKPRAVKRLQDENGYEASECVFVGDEITDIDAAKKAGIRCIAVTWGFNTAASIVKHRPAAIIEKPSELNSVLRNLL